MLIFITCIMHTHPQSPALPINLDTGRYTSIIEKYVNGVCHVFLVFNDNVLVLNPEFMWHQMRADG
jgi:hypothetical protein